MIDNKIEQIIKTRSKLHINDPAIEESREKLIKVLSSDEKQTINFLNKANKETVLWISEVFEEVSYNLQSKKYIAILEQLDLKYPDLNLTDIVQIAKEYID